jgi:DNA-binding MarR family transcriptional regulator
MERYPGGTWEGRVYISRSEQGLMRVAPSATFDKISDASGLSEGRTYQILRELEDRGYITIEEGYDQSGTVPQRCWEYRMTDAGRRALEEENEC